MIALSTAQQLVIEKAKSFGKEKISLNDATGRVLNQSIIADRDYPPFNRATMDGIAINYADWRNGTNSFTVAETIFAGKKYTKEIQPGECYKIMTGAAVPPSANTVIRKEDLQNAENRLHITVSDITEGQNIAGKGTDINNATVIIQSNKITKPGTVTTLASLGYDVIEVEKLPTVSIITTGDEVVNINEPINEVQIRNSNAALLKALLEQWKIQPKSCEHIGDDEQLLTAAVEKQLQSDIIIMSGAVSAGDADFVPAVLSKMGVEQIFHKVAIRPGKPIWFGKFKNGPVVFALPGNPFSTFVTFKLFIEQFLRKSFGLQDDNWLHLPFNGSRTKKTNLDEFFPVQLNTHPASIAPLPFNTSGDITAMLFADALAMQPIDQKTINKGDLIKTLLL